VNGQPKKIGVGESVKKDYSATGKNMNEKIKGRRFISALICAFFALPFLAVEMMNRAVGDTADFIRAQPLVSYSASLLFKAEYAMRDELAKLGRKAPADQRIVFIAIDSPSIKLDQFDPEEIKESEGLSAMAQGWPWPRSVYALALQRLFDAGAKAVVLDILFVRPSVGDAELARALDKYSGKVLVGANLSEVTRSEGSTQSIDLPHEGLIPSQSVNDPRVALVNFKPDPDNVIRRAHYRFLSPVLPPSGVPSLAAKTTEIIGVSSPANSPTPTRLLRFAGVGGTYQPISFWQIFDEKTWSSPTLKNGGVFKDKIVIIGPEANWSHDEFSTPLGVMPGAEVHINAIAAILNQQFLDDLPYRFNFISLLLAIFLAWGVNELFRNPLFRIVGIAAVCLAWHVTCQWLFNGLGFFPACFPPPATFLAGSLVTLVFEFILEQIEKRRVRATLERYVSKNVVEEVLAKSAAYQSSLGGVRKPVTVMFSDIRGFTTMTESADSAALVAQLNEYLTEMVECVFAHRGTLDKFIGDAVMAVWGNAAPRSAKEDAFDAVGSAIEMRDALKKLNDHWSTRGMSRMEIGIGLNHGDVIVGNMGSPKRMEFTVIGDAVNLASRIEGLTKEYHLDLLLGESVAHLVEGRMTLRQVALVQVKGKTKPVEVFTVPHAWQMEQEDFKSMLSLYTEGIAFYRKRRFKEASAIFKECSQKVPSDYLSSFYLEQSSYLASNPPPDNWNGVTVMTKK